MSCIKRAFEDRMYSMEPIDAFDWLVDNGWSESEASQIVEMFYGEL